MNSKKKSNLDSRLQFETLNHRLMLDGAGFIEPTFYEPTPYLSPADTPAGFLPVPDCDECIVGLETFEDNSLDFGLQIDSGQIIGPGFSTGLENLTDSVDSDDGEIDGSGQSNNLGSSYFTFGNSLTITLPSLMQSAGLVWTDGAPNLTDVIFEAFDENGNSLGTVNAGPIADSEFTGTTAEDRFFGISYGDGVTSGVTSISITNVGGQGIEIDHIQFANCSECCEIDLELTKSADVTTAESGDIVTWTIEVTNNVTATEAATGVQIQDVLPDGVSINGANVTVTDGNYSFSTGVWRLFDPLEPGESETLTIETIVGDGLADGTTLVNVAQVIAADQSDVDSTPNNDDGDQSEDDEANAVVTISAPEVIDLELSKSADVSVVESGDLVTWTIEVTNNPEATVAATGVQVQDVLPDGVTINGVNVTVTDGNYSFSSGVWRLFDPLDPGETETLTIETIVGQGLSDGTSLVNTAQVIAADQTDVDSTPNNDDGDQSEDDEANALVTVSAAQIIDLELTKDVNATIVNSGDNVIWTITVTNNPAAATTSATGVSITDVLPDGVSLVSATPSGNGSFVGNTWALNAPLAPGEAATLTLVTSVNSGLVGGSTLVNTAYVATAVEDDIDSTPGDANLTEDDADNAVVTIASVIDLEVEKTADADIVEGGDSVTWTIEVTNNPTTANVAATNVTLTDVLPDGVTATGINATSGMFLGNTWSLLEPLALGETATLTVVTTINEGLAGGTVLVNTAFVATANEQDVDSTPGDANLSEDDADAAQVTVKELIDLELTKVLADDADLTSGQFQWLITLTNTSAANTAATGVQVGETLPSGVTLLNATPTGDSIYANGVWTINQAIAPGDSLSLTIVGEVDSDVTGVLTNVVEVIAADQMDIDSTPANDDGDQSEDDESSAQIVISDEPLMLSGFSYIDTNDDGIFQENELPLLGVLITLEGTDNSGNAVNRSTFTDIDGFYKFDNLSPGDYMVSQTQPVQFLDGQDTLGNLGGDDSVNDKFTVELSDNGEEYNFGELGLLPEYLNKRLYLASTPYTNWEYIDVQQASIWYSFDVAHQSFLDLYGVVSNGSATAEIFDANMNLVEVRNFGVSSAAVQQPVLLQDDGQYYLRLSGDTVIDSLSVDVTSPSISVDGDQLIAVGTAGDDQIELQLGLVSHVLNINGLIYEYDATAVTDLHVGASTGDDTIVVTGTELDDRGSAIGTNGQLTSSRYSVHTYSAEQTHFVGGGGYDYSQVYGSTASDMLASFPGETTLTTPNHVLKMVGFDRVDAYGRGGWDYASLYGTHEDDTLFATEQLTVLSGNGHHAVAKGFERIDAFGRGGNDAAALHDSTGNDAFYSTPTHTALSTPTRLSYVKGFESTDVKFGLGGTDSVHYLGLTDQDAITATANSVQASRPGRIEKAEQVDRLFAAGLNFAADVDDFEGELEIGV